MITFEKSTFINCTSNDLFDFHLDTSNLVKITPPNISVELLAPEVILKKGEIIKLKSIKNLIPIFWEVKIETFDRPRKIVDIAVKSPFKYWEHQHIFIKHENCTELKDIIIYKLPYGVIGELFESLIYNDLNKMFNYRHIETKKILEKDIHIK